MIFYILGTYIYFIFSFQIEFQIPEGNYNLSLSCKKVENVELILESYTIYLKLTDGIFLQFIETAQ